MTYGTNYELFTSGDRETDEMRESYYKQNAIYNLVRKLIEEGKVQPEKWYSVRCRKNIETVREEGVKNVEYRIEIKPVREEVVKIKRPEGILMPPERSFRKRLKNCVNYLRQR